MSAAWLKQQCGTDLGNMTVASATHVYAAGYRECEHRRVRRRRGVLHFAVRERAVEPESDYNIRFLRTRGPIQLLIAQN